MVNLLFSYLHIPSNSLSIKLSTFSLKSCSLILASFVFFVLLSRKIFKYLFSMHLLNIVAATATACYAQFVSFFVVVFAFFCWIIFFWYFLLWQILSIGTIHIFLITFSECETDTNLLYSFFYFTTMQRIIIVKKKGKRKEKKKITPCNRDSQHFKSYLDLSAKWFR